MPGQLSLKDRGLGVPGGFRFLQKETGHLVTAPHWWALVNGVTSHRKSNQLPVPLGIEREIEQQLCESLVKDGADNFVQELDQTAAVLAANARTHKLRFRDIANFTVTMADHWFRGKALVDQTTANARAVICAECPLNVPVADCGTCEALKRTVKAVTGSRVTPVDGNLKACAVCGCFNSAQVWFPLDVLQRHVGPSENAQLANNCWKKRQ